MTSTQKENKPQGTINEVGGENMEQVIESATPGRNKAMIKAFMFVAFVIIAIYIFKFTPVKGYLTAEALGNFLDTVGLWLLWLLYLFMPQVYVYSCLERC